jgi:transcriptional regulator with XRE-family HTH domain
MDQEKFGKLIKDIRKKHNLTQKDLADKYNVTYQAVSKWENGINLPDISLIKKICEDYDIDINNVLDVKIKKKNKLLYIIILLDIILGILLIIKFNSNDDFEFKTLTTNCGDFKITGSISYNKNKSAIYISNIDYCGGDDIETYKEISCTLYEKNNDTTKVISSCKSNKNIKLEDYLKNVNISVDNYVKDCKEYSENSLYLEINALNKNNKTINYKIPVILNDTCKKD